MLRCPWCIGRLATRIKERLRGIFERLIDKHHSAIGVLVKEQKDRLTDEQLVAMIRDRVGDDLDWIRINGTLVGGTIGLVIFLAIRLLVRAAGAAGARVPSCRAVP